MQIAVEFQHPKSYQGENAVGKNISYSDSNKKCTVPRNRRPLFKKSVKY